MPDQQYDRQAAVEYAHKWAFGRNPRYADFETMGGDCTNFASQCIHAGGAPMNYRPTLGWYYISLARRAPAWTGVQFLYQFLTRNQGVGPYAREAEAAQAEPGDLIQLSFDGQRFTHSPVIVSVVPGAGLAGIRIAAHSQDADNRLVLTYPFVAYRVVHIEGIRN